MQIINQLGGKDNLVLSKAILLYEGANISYASVHEVKRLESKAVIGAGQPLGLTELENTLSSLGKSFKEGFVSESLIYSSAGMKLWWRKPGKAPIFIKEKDKEEQSLIAEHPGLVFGLRGRTLYVFAVKGSERPNKDTELYFSPYFNVNEFGSVCTGNTKMPDAEDSSMFTEWEDSFFGSYFTHHSRNKIIKSKLGFTEFWKKHAESGKPFPDKALFPMEDVTLEDVVTGWQGNNQ
jgi:PRTRC genetic system protein B